MKVRALVENLRKTILNRIVEGEFTGVDLANQTGFKQAHISNFLNRKRGLSVEGIDRILSVQRISVLDLLDPVEINKRASIVLPAEDEFENILVVEGSVAAGHPRIAQMHVQEIVKFKKSFLRKVHPEMGRSRDHWDRFIVVKADAREGMSMYPRLLPGATVLIDRHYNSFKPYRKGGANIYAVNKNGACSLKYVEAAGHNLVLRPHNPAYPIEILPIEEGKSGLDYLIGRVCYVGMEA